ncbi:hypothetical protein EVAR_89020_1 [Eumeta japonica]|uniref:Uncharacterized protein n=1 Tax=Eumeta variegata TaxID=151549 RepID=A0A4C1XC46_EUMVA|nr:hypothetical protein EVAR_89020_1 [Eumeta japonica]
MDFIIALVTISFAAPNHTEQSGGTFDPQGPSYEIDRQWESRAIKNPIHYAVDTHLYGGLRQVQLRRQLAPPRPRHVVLLEKLLLQPGELFPRERRPVPPDVRVGVVAHLLRLRAQRV